MASVFRLEHKNKKYEFPTFYLKKFLPVSPYNIDEVISSELLKKKYGDVFNEINVLHSSNEEFPTPFKDGLEDIFTEEFFCGCPSIDKLYDWFFNTEEWLRIGFVIREYKVKKRYISKSKKQCIFHYENIISRKIIS